MTKNCFTSIDILLITTMEHNSAPFSTILKDILPEVVKDYAPHKEKLEHFV